MVLHETIAHAALTRRLSPDVYLGILNRPEEANERQRLIERLTVHTTWFMREPQMMDALVKALAREVGANRTIDFWCVGCSTGPEPFSFAMAALEAGLSPRVLATDISRAALDVARRARYRARALAEKDPSATYELRLAIDGVLADLR